MRVRVNIIQSIHAHAWDAYVNKHPKATLYHLSGWKNVIEKTYGHKTYYLMAVNSSNTCEQNEHSSLDKPIQNLTNGVVGILPIVHMKNFFFGNSLVSIPFFDMGGILADNEEIEKVLLTEAVKLGQKLKVKSIELRQAQPLTWLSDSSNLSIDDQKNTSLGNKLSSLSHTIQSHKVRMLLELPDSSEALMKSFKSKFRTKIKKPKKMGLNFRLGGVELLDNFYEVFLVNMRDLGSPVHSKKIIQNIFKEFSEKAIIGVVYKNNIPLACGMGIGFKNTLENPWSSALRQHRAFRPNTLLYWSLLAYACDNGFKFFDFGRSTPDEGTYKFKKQWGAKPEPLYWHYISMDDKPVEQEISDKSKFDTAIRLWQKMPVGITKIIGPVIRKHIAL
ncbi:hypothetical protein BuS5_00038 [Desulfosarcina sp. BuS5]|uniref:peptidoglycan bridge formation glycyltransferase FemA/FemB family protein n=1 Tax=Desulfosarcina sp. BuS5 TaxID=933262 RepID=UPI000B31D4D4|nr:peptidoglycan bridge formation glycyltransferase FemA/FemB family protein [Desulfosarcina sp. BuS5]WDN87070.1 hypothetical protein BuS5_00038 [Desulfosarcina sp. BuS5]